MRYTFFFIILSALVLVGCSGPSNRVTSVTPQDGDTDVSVDVQIQVTFRGEVDPHSVGGGFSLADAGGNPIEGVVALGDDRRSASFTPSMPLAYGTLHVATVNGKEAKPGKGQPPHEFSYSWSFRTQPDPVVTVSLHSHKDGQKVFGPRSITLSGGLSSSSAITEVVVRHNGVAVPGVEFRQTYFTVSGLELRDNNENDLEVLATNEAGKQGRATLALDYPYFRLEDGQEAAVALGKKNGDYYSAGTGANQFETGLRGDPAYYEGSLYLPDHMNHRVVIHHGVPSVDGASARGVVGQPGFDNNPTSGNQADQLNLPGGAAIADGRLFVADTANHRVLIWDSLPLDNSPADRVLGQSGFGSSVAGCGATGLNAPQGVFVVDGKLLVADRGNNRVLIWNTMPSASGAAADRVIGQKDMATCAAAPNPTGSTLKAPADVWSDGVRVVVADSGNNRVLVWDAFPVHDYEPATSVVGQSGFDDGSSRAPAADSLNVPYAVASNGNQLFVADAGNNRVLVWDQIPSSNGVLADNVLGQGDFRCNIENSSSAEDGSCWYGFDYGVTKRMLSSPAGLHLFPGGLLVADGGYANNRYLIFEPLAQPW